MTTVNTYGRRTVAAVGLEGVVRTDAQRSRGFGLRSDLEAGISHSEVGDDDGICVDIGGHGSGDDERRGGEESEDGELHYWSLRGVKIRMCR